MGELLRSKRWAALAILITVMATGCTNNLAQLGSRFSSRLPASDPMATFDNTSSSAPVNLTRVVKDATDSNALNLIGDGTGSMGLYCTAKSGGGNTGPSTCLCDFSFTKSDGTQQNIQVDTSYHENDLIRCPYTEILSAASPISVRIYVSNSDSYSNTVTYTMSTTGTATDLTMIENYSKVVRYQCQDILTLPWLWGGSNGLYDPIQSEDQKINFPINFYTTNISGSLMAFAAQNNPNWRCPSVFDPTQFINTSVTKDFFNIASSVNPTEYSLVTSNAFGNGQGLAMRIYSRYPYNGTKVIYSPDSPGPWPRHDFFLSKNSTSVFNVAINALVAPTVISAEGSTTAPPIGYGALPVPSGTGKETCPASSTVTIPSGYHWVKVWLFRAELPVRHYVQSDAILKTGSVSCNPGFWQNGQDAGVPQQVFGDCPGSTDEATNYRVSNSPSCKNNLPVGCTAATQSAATKLNGSGYAQRVLGTNRCVDISTNQAAPAGLSFSSTIDSWAPVQEFTTAGGVAGGSNFPLKATSADPMNYLLSAWPNAYNPIDIKPTPQDIDVLASGAIRYDFLFVTTPEDVMYADISNSESSVGRVFTPYRFQTNSDCAADDPDAPGSGCSDKSRIIRYGIKTHDIGSNGDPPASDPKRAGVFPVCAIQKE